MMILAKGSVVTRSLSFFKRLLSSKLFNIKTTTDLLYVYNVSDVLLLADVWESFMNVELQSYNLNPNYYISLPSLCWDITIKKSEIELELLTDENMLMVFENGKRRGLSQCSKRYAVANNKYLPNYDHTKKSTYLLYTDANSLYPATMIMNLPYKNLQENGEIPDRLNELLANDYDQFVSQIMLLQDKGMQFVVDLTYTNELHDRHKDYPLALEHMKINKVKKLVGTLCGKKEYSLHIRMLCLYIQLGLRVTRIHKVITFDHSSWMKTYIDINIEKRKQAKVEKYDFHSNLYKLKNN